MYFLIFHNFIAVLIYINTFKFYLLNFNEIQTEIQVEVFFFKL